ncbi:hypothetical protein NL676_036505 [Syzygium grande]|nr:hypothetical protein NL676_036505 [Syzygium grande]
MRLVKRSRFPACAKRRNSCLFVEEAVDAKGKAASEDQTGGKRRRGRPATINRKRGKISSNQAGRKRTQNGIWGRKHDDQCIGKIEIRSDPVEAMLLDMIPSLGMRKVETTDHSVEREKLPVEPIEQPQKKKKK